MTASVEAAVRVRVHGSVQGVGYRYFVAQAASTLKLTGWVKNLPDGTVEALAEGGKTATDEWIRRLKKGPPLAQVRHIDVFSELCKSEYDRFLILP